MRYSINEKRMFVFISEDQDNNINIKHTNLTCTEHHTVPVASCENNSTVDGFVFEDKNGNQWYNQYPYASYDQPDYSSN